MEDEMRALWLMDIALLWAMKDAGLLTTHQIQERLRQTKQMLSSRFGVGPEGLALIEEAMQFVTDKAGDPMSDVVPLQARPAGPQSHLTVASSRNDPADEPPS